MKNHVLYLSLIILIGCSPQQKKWGNAVTRNTITAYEEYLNEYPSGKYAPNAKDSIANLFCDSAINLKSIPLLEAFFTKYPDNTRTAEVKTLYQVLEWGNVKLSNNVDTIQTFINTYPEGTFIEDAKLLLDSVKYNPTSQTLEECMILATKTYFGNPDSKVRTTATIKNVHKYNKDAGYMIVEGMCTAFTNYGEFYSIPKYFKLTLDDKGKWSAIYIAE